MKLAKAFLAVDRWVNYLCGGAKDATVSARVGFCVEYYRAKGILKDPFGRGMFWWVLSQVIDFAFKPIDGPDHCLKAMTWEKKKHYSRGSDAAKAGLALISFVFCAVFSVGVRVAVWVKPEWRYTERLEK